MIKEPIIEVEKVWGEEEIEKLISLYPNTLNDELVSIFRRSLKSIRRRAERLHLKRERECFSKQMGLSTKAKHQRGCFKNQGLKLSQHFRDKTIKNPKCWNQVGELNPNWKGDKIKSIDRRLRESIALIQWRNVVFRYDNYTCQLCHKRGGRLEAHHIFQFAYYPELRTEITNGVTLCYKCHKSIRKKESDFVDLFRRNLVYA